MAGDSFNVMQGILIRSTLHHEVVSKSLSRDLFTKYLFNRSSDFGISFDGYTTILSIPWHDVIHCAQVLLFFWQKLRSVMSLGTGIPIQVGSQICSPRILAVCFGILWRLASVVTAVPSQEVCRHTGLPHPQLATCTSTNHSI